MNCTIVYLDKFCNEYLIKSSSSKNLHEDLLNLFKDQCEVIEVYGDYDLTCVTVGNRPITPNNEMECEFK